MNKQSKHLGIIPDGGRRWARKNNVSYVEAYKLSFSRLYYVLLRAYGLGFSEVSVYVLSRDNLSRTPNDLHAVYSSLPTLQHTLQNACAGGFCESVIIVGQISLLPDEQQTVFRQIEAVHGKRGGLKVNLLVAYSAWDELHAAQINGNEITLETLWVTSKVDSVLRTGGSSLFSGFLPLQSQYAHLIATEEMFDDLSDSDFDRLLLRAAQISHLFGK